MKKVLDNPASAADDALEGMVLSSPEILRKLPGRRVVVRKDSPVMGKVALPTEGTTQGVRATPIDLEFEITI